MRLYFFSLPLLFSQDFLYRTAKRYPFRRPVFYFSGNTGADGATDGGDCGTDSALRGLHGRVKKGAKSPMEPDREAGTFWTEISASLLSFCRKAESPWLWHSSRSLSQAGPAGEGWSAGASGAGHSPGEKRKAGRGGTDGTGAHLPDCGSDGRKQTTRHNMGVWFLRGYVKYRLPSYMRPSWARPLRQKEKGKEGSGGICPGRCRYRECCRIKIRPGNIFPGRRYVEARFPRVRPGRRRRIARRRKRHEGDLSGRE